MKDVSKLSYPRVANHGGGCCGITHIFDFKSDFSSYGRNSPHYCNNKEELEARVRYLIKNHRYLHGHSNYKTSNRLFEAVLQESQRRVYEPILLKIGFKPVTEFTNTNSGHRVTVYHYSMGPKNWGAYSEDGDKTKKSPQRDSRGRFVRVVPIVNPFARL